MTRVFDAMFFIGGIILIMIIIAVTFPVTIWYLVKGRKIDDDEQRDY